jgi:hypothetical protein
VNYQVLSQIESGQPFLTDTTLISVVENQIKYEGFHGANGAQIISFIPFYNQFKVTN